MLDTTNRTTEQPGRAARRPAPPPPPPHPNCEDSTTRRGDKRTHYTLPKAPSSSTAVKRRTRRPQCHVPLIDTPSPPPKGKTARPGRDHRGPPPRRRRPPVKKKAAGPPQPTAPRKKTTAPLPARQANTASTRTHRLPDLAVPAPAAGDQRPLRDSTTTQGAPLKKAQPAQTHPHPHNDLRPTPPQHCPSRPSGSPFSALPPPGGGTHPPPPAPLAAHAPPRGAVQTKSHPTRRPTPAPPGQPFGPKPAAPPVAFQRRPARGRGPSADRPSGP